VSIEGHGGDELFGGYTNHVTSLIGDLIVQRNNADKLSDAILLLSELSSSFTSNRFNTQSILMNTPLRSSALHSGKNQNRLYLLGLFGDSEKCLNRKISVLDNELYSQESLFFKSLYEDFHYYTLPNILRNYDRLSMKHSVEIRSPFLDYRLVLKAFSAPVEYKINNKQSKYFLRNKIPFIPNEIKRRKTKSGFTHPINKWFSTVFTPLINDIIHQKKFKESNLFNGKVCSNILSNHISKNNATELSRYWPIINLALIDGI
jgi:asparagine synthase (glutamine-hydrolysing)